MTALCMLAAFGFGVLGGWACWGRERVSSGRRLIEECTQDYCNSWQDSMCGSGHCAHHCFLYCRNNCTPVQVIDPKTIEKLVTR